jgi:single-stranded-DNA-specific exonuclease
VISVDCGTRDIAAIRHAKSLGIDVIVTDHHAVPSIIPEEAVAIISVKLPNSPYPYKWLSGSGTAFKLLHAVASKIYSVEELPDILTSYIDFAMLGTVADMMPLTGENRIIVKLGLAQATSSRSPGLRRMMAGKNTANADCVGFYVGPRINAAGRMDHAETALKALICSDIQVGSLLDELENLNTERKGSTAHFVEEALESIDPSQNGVIYRSENIDHGVIGLVAGRLAERLGKPAIACLQ